MFDNPTDLADLDVRVSVTPLPPGGATHAVLVHADATDADELALDALDARAGELLADALAELWTTPPAGTGE